MYSPPVISLDYETALTDGTPSLDYYRPDFRVISAAFAYRDGSKRLCTKFVEGEDEICLQLQRLSSSSTVVVHNYQFEYGVTAARFPGYEHLITADTMRLVQVGDNGGKQAAYEPQISTYDDVVSRGDGEDTPSHSTGLGLMSAASRWLDKEWHNHKEPFHSWLREQGVKKGQEGRHLNELPPSMFEEYNTADAKVTLLLYETLIAEFTRIGYDHTLDHSLYLSTARMVAKAKGVGAKVNREALEIYAKELQLEIDSIETAFRERFSDIICSLETSAFTDHCSSLKTEKGRVAANPGKYKFNIGSNKQLKELFVDRLGVKPTFWTKPAKGRSKEAEPFVPSPSFKAAHLSTYGEGGLLLVKRRKRLLVLQQVKALLELSEYDSKWHWDIRVAGTATGRLIGGRGD